MPVAALFVTANNWKQPTCSLKGEWISKFTQWNITQQLKRSEIIQHDEFQNNYIE